MRRIQVTIDEAEYRTVQRIARRAGMTLTEWVRQTLRTALREEFLSETDRKLAVVRTAATHEYPTADIAQMLAETARGYEAAGPR